VFNVRFRHPHQSGVPRYGMAAKLSKAKRPKRRWIGFSFPSSICSRSEIEGQIQQLFPADIHFRLYDAHFHGSDVAKASCEHQSIKDNIGLGIMCVNLVDYDAVREVFSTSSTDGRIHSLSSSGKIRLVRQRLGLPKPKKK
tara:strand:+ start:840 stop:1262 length:423 start_codon:yes stop_codon:yes gene_type:complete